MKADNTRFTFKQKNHYSGVRMQQGRVQLDADWNEQVDITRHRVETETVDTVGHCGVPMHHGGFHLVANANDLTTEEKGQKENQNPPPLQSGSDFYISGGRSYLDGILCQNDQIVPFSKQPNVPDGPLPASLPNLPEIHPPTQSGTYLAYLDVWSRHITALEDPEIREVALGGPDTATRTKTIWQVKLHRAGDVGIDANCLSVFDSWKIEIAPGDGKLAARAEVGPKSTDPCIVAPGAGYRRLENQLYRVEVHKGGNLGTATFKWSRDNGSIVTKWEKQDIDKLTVSSIGRDKVLNFASGQWVELTDDTRELLAQPGTLVQLVKVQGEVLTIDSTTATGPVDRASFPNNPKVRRWDSDGEVKPTNSSWIDLEDGVQVQFSAGSYKTGDYWLIPARTATADVEWPIDDNSNQPELQLPYGICHHYCRLALIKAYGGHASVEDCREKFPPLTDIHADDVEFDNTTCAFANAETVQDALDILCGARDLRHHNKHMHGHGVVCGLKVTCGPQRHQVVIENGYALDCEGNDIIVNKDNDEKGIVFDIVTAAKNYLNGNGTGTVRLSIAQGGIISVELHENEDFLDTVLEGTLLKDYFEDCIQSFIIFLTGQFPINLNDTPPLPIEQKRLTAVINLFAQLINSASGPYGFLSGDTGPTSENTIDEDTLLRKFHEDLKNFVESETYCAMFDNDEPYPDYEIDPGLSTIFGSAFKLHRRLRLHPTGMFAYTCGTGHRIYVYNLHTGELIQATEFLADSALHIQDVAINPDGSVLYAVGILNDTDSIFATATIDNDDGTLGTFTTSPACGTRYVSLRMGQTETLYAIKKGEGLFKVRGIGLPGFVTQSVCNFNATGLLEISDGEAFVGEYTSASDATFNQIIGINLNSPTDQVKFVVEGHDAENDIAVNNGYIYITGNPAPNHTKTLYAFDKATATKAWEVDLLEDTITRLAVITSTNGIPGGPSGCMLVTLADRFKAVAVDLENQELVSGVRIPTQIFPMDIVVTANSEKGYVLNSIVNTLTTIDIKTVFGSGQPNFTIEPPDVISSYRSSAIQAFEDLFDHTLEYLKDRFCKRFIVDCPECTEDDKVYLGTVDIKEKKVHNICNLTKRRYVKSFRTYGYWLSTIPVLPLIKRSFARFCCMILGS